MTALLRAILCFSLWLPALAQVPAGVQSSSPALTLAGAVREALDRSAEVEASARELDLASLEEPLILSNLDPQFLSSYAITDDRAPRALPAFQGPYSDSQRWDAGFMQNTLLGTEARLRFANEKLRNPALFRAFDPSVDSRLSIEINQPLLRYFWGRPDVARRRRAGSSVQQARARLRLARESTVIKACAAYLEYYFATELVSIKEGGARDAKALVAKYEDKKRYGLVEESDLLQARSSLEIQQTELLLARSQLERGANALWAVLLRDGSPPADLRTQFPEELPEPGQVAESEALARRADVEAARARREALEWNLRVERLDTLPDLRLSLSYSAVGLGSVYDAAWRDMGTFNHPVRTAGLAVAVPLTFRKERLVRRQAALQLERARADERETAAQAAQDIRNAKETLQLARRRTTSAKRLVELERRKFEAEEANFRRGRSSTDLLLRFQQDIRRAQTELLRAQTDEALARLDLARAQGDRMEAVFP
ncbi:MAG: TolC family protein [Elusimicrobia bacterium]|nr:TolC family protein [Elusimicrobiota bacterium]